MPPPTQSLLRGQIEDLLGICEELDCRLQYLVETYHDEWAKVVKDPERRAKFRRFVNTDENILKDSMIEFVGMRGQLQPADWPKDGQPHTNWKPPAKKIELYNFFPGLETKRSITETDHFQWVIDLIQRWQEILER